MKATLLTSMALGALIAGTLNAPVRAVQPTTLDPNPAPAFEIVCLCTASQANPTKGLNQ